MAQSWASMTAVPRWRHLDIALMTLFGLAVVTTGENLDAATDADPATDDFAVENSARLEGRLSIARITTITAF